MHPARHLQRLAAAFAFLAFPAMAAATDIPPAPELSRENLYQTNTYTVVLDGRLEDVREFMDVRPLTEFLEPSGRIPRITEVVVLDGPWGEIDSLRRVDLEGGFHVHERVLSNDEDEFTYQIWDITTSAGRFIDHIYGEIRLSEVADGTQVTWSYNVKPRFFFARPSIRSYLDDDFAPFMENGLTGFATAYTAQLS